MPASAWERQTGDMGPDGVISRVRRARSDCSPARTSANCRGSSA
jgi:hypothetical protein